MEGIFQVVSRRRRQRLPLGIQVDAVPLRRSLRIQLRDCSILSWDLLAKIGIVQQSTFGGLFGQLGERWTTGLMQRITSLSIAST